MKARALRIVAMHNVPPCLCRAAAARAGVPSWPVVTTCHEIAATRKVLHISDLFRAQLTRQRDPVVVGFVELAGVRTLLAVPMLKEKDLVGI